MIPNLALYGESETVEGFPGFIRVHPGAVPHVGNLALAINWWAPDYLDFAELDRAEGAKHFREAMATANEHGGSPSLLAYIMSCMRGHELGPMEMGFIEAFASKAAAGRPVRMNKNMATLAVELSGGTLTLQSIRAGETEGEFLLDAARTYHDPSWIEWQLIEIAKGNVSKISTGILWTICGAAMRGASN